MPNLVNKGFVTGAMRTGFSRRFANPKLQPNCGVSLQLYRLMAWPKTTLTELSLIIDWRDVSMTMAPRPINMALACLAVLIMWTLLDGGANYKVSDYKSISFFLKLALLASFARRRPPCLYFLHLSQKLPPSLSLQDKRYFFIHQNQVIKIWLFLLKTILSRFRSCNSKVRSCFCSFFWMHSSGGALQTQQGTLCY